jgi:hypothetical protein
MRGGKWRPLLRDERHEHSRSAALMRSAGTAVACVVICLASLFFGGLFGLILSWWIYADDIPETDYPSVFPDQTTAGSEIGASVGLAVGLFASVMLIRDARRPGQQAMQPRPEPVTRQAVAPSSSREPQSFVWALVFGTFIFLGGVAIEFSTLTALVVALLAGCGVYLLVRWRGGDAGIVNAEDRSPGPGRASGRPYRGYARRNRLSRVTTSTRAGWYVRSGLLGAFVGAVVAATALTFSDLWTDSDWLIVISALVGGALGVAAVAVAQVHDNKRVPPAR